MDGRGSNPVRDKMFLFFTSSIPALGSTKLPIQRALRAISPGVKRPEREADHLSPSSAEVKNSGGVSPLPHTSLWHRA
jgi:hypothetical protein